MDMSGLTPRQRANVASLRVKKEAIKRKYGDAVQIVTTEAEAAAAKGWLAIPLKEIPTNQQLTVKMDREVIDTHTMTRIKQQRRGEHGSSDLGDVVTALERAAGITTETEAPTAEPVKKIGTSLPKATVVGLSDADFVRSLMA